MERLADSIGFSMGRTGEASAPELPRGGSCLLGLLGSHIAESTTQSSTRTFND